MSIHRRRLLLLFLTFVLAAVWRAAPGLAEPELRAEDATVFFMGARERGAAALLEEHNGYHHLVPRLLAAIAAALPCRLAPTLYLRGAFLVMLGLGLLFLARGMPMRGRLTVLLVPILLPQDGTVIGHLADLGSVAALALVPLALRRPEGRRRDALVALLIFALAAMSGPHVVFLLPVIGAIAVFRRRGRDLALLAVALVAAWLQGRHLPDARVAGDDGLALEGLLAVLGARGPAALLGLRPAEVASDLLPILGLGSLLLTVALAIMALGYGRYRSMALLAGSQLVLAATLWAYRHDPGLLLENPFDRYAFVQLTLFLWSILALVARPGRARRALDLTLAALLVLGSLRLSAPEVAAVSIGGWRHSCELLAGDLPAAIPIEPGWLIDHRPADPRPDWERRIANRVFGSTEIGLIGPGSPRLGRIGEGAALVVRDDQALILPAGSASGELIATVLPRLGRPGPEDEVEFIVEELMADGGRRRIAAHALRPLRDHQSRLPWRPAGALPASDRTLVLRCETRGGTRWWLFWGSSRPLTPAEPSAK